LSDFAAARLGALFPAHFRAAGFSTAPAVQPCAAEKSPSETRISLNLLNELM
jgi:hypothetical protein